MQVIAQMGKQLAESGERFRKLVEVLPDAIVVLSEDGIVFVNPFGAKLLRVQQLDRLGGKDISEIIHPDSLAFIRSHVWDCCQTGVASPPIKQALILLGGSRVQVESRAISATWNGSKVSRW